MLSVKDKLESVSLNFVTGRADGPNVIRRR